MVKMAFRHFFQRLVSAAFVGLVFTCLVSLVSASDVKAGRYAAAPDLPTFTQEISLYLKHFKRGLNYFDEHSRHISLDAMFSLQMIKGHLLAVREQMSPSGKSRLPAKLPTIVFDLAKQVEDVVDTGLASIRHTHSLKTHQYFQQLGFVITHKWLPASLNHDVSMSLSTPAADRVRKVFSERTSDTCMAEIVGTGPSHQRCSIPDMCRAVMFKPYGFRSSHYALTHQLLMALLAEGRGCKKQYEHVLQQIASEKASDPSRARTVRQLYGVACANILLEMQATMESNKSVDSQNEDIFMEQGALCAMAGYPSVLRSEWLRRIVPWQTGLGCIDDGRGIATRAGHRQGRDVEDSDYLLTSSSVAGRKLLFDPQSNDGCSQHATSLYITYLMGKIRYMIELQMGVHRKDLSKMAISLPPSASSDSAASANHLARPENEEEAQSRLSTVSSHVVNVSKALWRRLEDFRQYMMSENY